MPGGRDWNVIFRDGADGMPWRDEDDALAWAEALSVGEVQAIELGMPMFILLLSKRELAGTAAGLRRLALARPTDSCWLEDWANDVAGYASEVDAGSEGPPAIASGIPQWCFELRTVWWFSQVGEQDAKTLTRALTGLPHEETPILWADSEVGYCGGDRVSAEIIDDAWGSLAPEEAVPAPLHTALRDWISFARTAEACEGNREC